MLLLLFWSCFQLNRGWMVFPSALVSVGPEAVNESRSSFLTPLMSRVGSGFSLDFPAPGADLDLTESCALIAVFGDNHESDTDI